MLISGLDEDNTTSSHCDKTEMGYFEPFQYKLVWKLTSRSYSAHVTLFRLDAGKLERI
jgi:hypothetical protein